MGALVEPKRGLVVEVSFMQGCDVALELPWAEPVRVSLPSSYAEYKDPCIAWYDREWHLFATGILPNNRFHYQVVHGRRTQLGTHWSAVRPVALARATGPSVCAPGVVSDGELVHLFIQQAYNVLGSSIMHFVSADGGLTFERRPDALQARADTGEAGLYDAHPATVAGSPYLAYSATSVVGQSDIHLARAAGDDWNGPWERLGLLIGHADVPWHNQPGDADYEWGLEGAQLLELPDGRVLLTAVGFLAGHPRGHRQRVFLSLAEKPTGPYRFLGHLPRPASFGENGENGHATSVVTDGMLFIMFQARQDAEADWQLYATQVPLAALLAVVDGDDELRTSSSRKSLGPPGSRPV